jgi:hypothetical protein
LSFLGTIWRVDDQELSKRRAVPSFYMPSNSALAKASRSGASRRGRQVTGGPAVVRMRWSVLWRTSRWTTVGRMKSRKSENSVDRRITRSLSRWESGNWQLGQGADNQETPSSRRFFLQSTKRPTWERKSAPMRGCDVAHDESPSELPEYD